MAVGNLMTKKNRNKKQSARPRAAVAPVSRRAFLWSLWLGLGVVAVAEYALVAVNFLRPRRRHAVEEDDAVVVAGPLDRFEPNSVTAFRRGQFYLARLADGGFLALSRKCTHLGCTVPWDGDGGRFVCPCHSSAFDITGEVLSPPAPRALDWFPVRIENGIVKVDTRIAMKRNSFEIAQVTRP
jgi:cytochrome b6-f complex iron-sulfur subunit